MASILLPDSEKALLLIKGALGPSQIAQAFPSTYGEKISSTVSALTEASARITEVQIVLTPSQATRPPASLGLNDTQAVISTIQLIQSQIASATTAGTAGELTSFYVTAELVSEGIEELGNFVEEFIVIPQRS